MNDKTRKLLFDVLDSGRAILHWRTGRTYEDTFPTGNSGGPSSVNSRSLAKP
jgi:hypothetical protein